VGSVSRTGLVSQVGGLAYGKNPYRKVSSQVFCFEFSSPFLYEVVFFKIFTGNLDFGNIQATGYGTDTRTHIGTTFRLVNLIAIYKTRFKKSRYRVGRALQGRLAGDTGLYLGHESISRLI
jgi:hypothetical protein